MKKLSFIISFTFIVQIAAGSPKPQDVLDLLSLPPANRKSLIQKNPEYYNGLKEILLNTQISMPQHWQAVMSMAQSKGSQVEKDLIDLSRHKTWYFRNAALVALEKNNSSKKYEIARERLEKDKALVVRSAAVKILASSKAAEDRQALWKSLSDKKNFVKGQSLWIRAQVAKVLLKSTGLYEKNLFLSLLNDSDPRVAQVAGAYQKALR